MVLSYGSIQGHVFCVTNAFKERGEDLAPIFSTLIPQIMSVNIASSQPHFLIKKVTCLERTYRGMCLFEECSITDGCIKSHAVMQYFETACPTMKLMIFAFSWVNFSMNSSNSILEKPDFQTEFEILSNKLTNLLYQMASVGSMTLFTLCIKLAIERLRRNITLSNT